MQSLHSTVIAVAEDKKSSQIKLIDMENTSDICSFQLLCSAENERHAQAIADSIEKECRNKLQIRANTIEGKSTGSWILMDFGSLLVHIFLKETRAYYAFDSLCIGKKIIYPTNLDNHKINLEK